jgi:hypothetical protein
VFSWELPDRFLRVLPLEEAEGKATGPSGRKAEEVIMAQTKEKSWLREIIVGVIVAVLGTVIAARLGVREGSEPAPRQVAVAAVPATPPPAPAKTTTAPEPTRPTTPARPATTPPAAPARPATTPPVVSQPPRVVRSLVGTWEWNEYLVRKVAYYYANGQMILEVYRGGWVTRYTGTWGLSGNTLTVTLPPFAADQATIRWLSDTQIEVTSLLSGFRTVQTRR